MKIGLFVLFNDKPLEEVWLRRRSRLRDGRARRLARIESLRHRPRCRGSRLREGRQEGARRPGWAQRSRTTSSRRWCCRSATRSLDEWAEPPTRRRWSSSNGAHHQDGRGRLTLEIPTVCDSSDRPRGRAGTSGHRSAWRSTKKAGSSSSSAGARSSTAQGARRPVCPRGPPTEIAYNVYTAEEAIKRLDRDDWGFNFPSHLIWQMIDPVVFIKVTTRIFHAHAKDWELQKDILHIDGVTSGGSWRR